jgi:hypothetical protein
MRQVGKPKTSSERKSNRIARDNLTSSKRSVFIFSPCRPYWLLLVDWPPALTDHCFRLKKQLQVAIAVRAVAVLQDVVVAQAAVAVLLAAVAAPDG